jgi:hypothetical protein
MKTIESTCWPIWSFSQPPHFPLLFENYFTNKAARSIRPNVDEK